MVVFGLGGCIRASWLYLGKVVVFGQKWLYWDKSGYIRVKGLLYSGKVAVFGQSGGIRTKVVVFGQKWFYLCKEVVFGQKWLYSGKVVV